MGGSVEKHCPQTHKEETQLDFVKYFDDPHCPVLLQSFSTPCAMFIFWRVMGVLQYHCRAAATWLHATLEANLMRNIVQFGFPLCVSILSFISNFE